MKNLTEMSNEELWELFPIVLCGHKEEWKQMYENEKKLLLHSIGRDQVARISHIGSTAVKGFWLSLRLISFWKLKNTAT